jgi:molybdopterin molybdotransferase
MHQNDPLPITPLSDVIAVVMSKVPAVRPEAVAVADSWGRILTEDVVARRTIPPFDSSAMDGFALCFEGPAASAGADFDVVATIAAGNRWDGRLRPGQAARIMTGAPVPAGTSTVVMVERTAVTTLSGGGETVAITEDVKPGAHIRGAGEDVRPGDIVLSAGRHLDPPGVAAAVNAGVPSLLVGARPRVAVCTSGDELAADGADLSGAQIPDSNRPMLLAAVKAAGAIPVDGGRLPDTREQTLEGIKNAVSRADIVITTGGVSAGDFDHVQYVLGDLGWSQRFRIAMKPGKPFSFAVIDDTLVFGLPGNPVSAYVTFELLVRPAIRAAMGSGTPSRPWIPARFAADRPAHHDGKTHFLRITASWDESGLTVAPVQGQGSHQMSALAASHGIAALTSGRSVARGDLVSVMLWN